jgi:hypothetical protein
MATAMGDAVIKPARARIADRAATRIGELHVDGVFRSLGIEKCWLGSRR